MNDLKFTEMEKIKNMKDLEFHVRVPAGASKEEVLKALTEEMERQIIKKGGIDMAPDKIFLQVCGSCNIDDVTCENCEFAKLLEGGEVTWSEDRIYEKDVEYIRKDFLMERLARAKELRERHSSNPNTLREYIAPIEALMDIINSL